MAGFDVQEFNEVKLDAIGEIQNITMGSAATAVSNLLSSKVWITTPKVQVKQLKDVSYPDLEPCMYVKIRYIKGISGISLLVLKQSDVQLILNQLMGMPLIVTDDFEFDEINISAVCEVMNQMMGASATALADILATEIDISTPEAIISDESKNVSDLQGQSPDDYVCVISFNITIDGVINSEFVTMLSMELATEMADKMLNVYNQGLEETTISNQQSVPKEQPSSTGDGGMMSDEAIQAMLVAASSSNNSEPKPASTGGGETMSDQAIQAMFAASNAASSQPSNQPTAQYQQEGGQHNAKASGVIPNSFNAQQFTNDEIDNLKLLVNVPLDVTIEVGSANRKVKDILEFTRGTVVELDSLANEPVNVVVNGNLIARGDVVVIDDNFAVRITEIVKSKFFDRLGNKE